ncbi:uncharacterized protein BXZ73DRAFT_83067 [Epithele typhae]|uniref:uncharacterized protein n=2 Tax=Epithele typhae TaxID=378194 RepID=UPI002008C832|nr:uncharacterized protein BXZ73DRAFT_83067 [Epithele typhae]KAH9910931.1 hypothetical protein BXZ73DRAFT_83067 [Epithele typhae]
MPGADILPSGLQRITETFEQLGLTPDVPSDNEDTESEDEGCSSDEEGRRRRPKANNTIRPSSTISTLDTAVKIVPLNPTYAPREVCRDPEAHNTRMTLVHEHGIILNAMLLRHGLYPGTWGDWPRTAFTLTVMEVFEAHLLQAQSSVHDLYLILRRMTDRFIPGSVQNREREILQATREYAYLMLCLRHAHRPGCPFKHNALVTLCPACPHPGKNMRPDWEWRDALFSFLDEWFIEFDGNFRQFLRPKTSDPLDLAYAALSSYFANSEDVAKHLEMVGDKDKEPSDCNNFKASGHTGHVGSVTGLIAGVCRHGFVAGGSMINLNKGERLSARSKGSRSGTTWDRPPDTGDDEDEKYYPALEVSIGDFHIKAHKEECQTVYNSMTHRGTARVGGEETEQCWAELDPTSERTQEMGPGNREDTLTFAVDNRNQTKMYNINSDIKKRHDKALDRRKKHQNFMRSLESTIPDDLLGTWETEMEAWLDTIADPTEDDDLACLNPFVLHVDEDMSFSEPQLPPLSAHGHTDHTRTIGNVAAMVQAVNLWEDGHEIQVELRRVDRIKGAEKDRQRRLVTQRMKAFREEVLSCKETYDRHIGRHIASAIGVYQSSARNMPRDFPRYDSFEDIPHTTEKDQMEDQRANNLILDGTLREWAEEVRLIDVLLPSMLHKDVRERKALSPFVRLETQLREQMVQDALDNVRRSIVLTTSVSDLREKTEAGAKAPPPSRHAKRKPRSEPIKLHEATISARAEYHRLRTILLRLSAKDIPPRLRDSDLKHFTVLHSQRNAGDTQRVPHWIWSSAKWVENISDKDQKRFALAKLKVLWFRTKAATARWEEEVYLCSEEMYRILGMWTYEKTRWGEMANQLHLDVNSGEAVYYRGRSLQYERLRAAAEGLFPRSIAKVRDTLWNGDASGTPETIETSLRGHSPPILSVFGTVMVSPTSLNPKRPTFPAKRQEPRPECSALDPGGQPVLLIARPCECSPERSALDLGGSHGEGPTPRNGPKYGAYAVDSGVACMASVYRLEDGLYDAIESEEILHDADDDRTAEDELVSALNRKMRMKVAPDIGGVDIPAHFTPTISPTDDGGVAPGALSASNVSSEAEVKSRPFSTSDTIPSKDVPWAEVMTRPFNMGDFVPSKANAAAKARTRKRQANVKHKLQAALDGALDDPTARADILLPRVPGGPSFLERHLGSGETVIEGFVTADMKVDEFAYQGVDRKRVDKSDTTSKRSDPQGVDPNHVVPPTRPPTMEYLRQLKYSYLKWDGKSELHVLDKDGRILIALVPPPVEPPDRHDGDTFVEAVTKVAALFEDLRQGHAEQIKAMGCAIPPPRRGQFGAVTMGLTMGNGTTKPCRLGSRFRGWEKDVEKQVLCSPSVYRVAKWQDQALCHNFPLAYGHLHDVMRQFYTEKPSLKPNFAGASLYPACTANLGPHTLSQNDVTNDKRRFSFTQFVPGGIVRYVQAGFKMVGSFKGKRRVAMEGGYKGARRDEQLARLSTQESLSRDRASLQKSHIHEYNIRGAGVQAMEEWELGGVVNVEEGLWSGACEETKFPRHSFALVCKTLEDSELGVVGEVEGVSSVVSNYVTSSFVTPQQTVDMEEIDGVVNLRRTYITRKGGKTEMMGGVEGGNASNIPHAEGHEMFDEEGVVTPRERESDVQLQHDVLVLTSSSWPTMVTSLSLREASSMNHPARAIGGRPLEHTFKMITTHNYGPWDPRGIKDASMTSPLESHGMMGSVCRKWPEIASRGLSDPTPPPTAHRLVKRDHRGAFELPREDSHPHDSAGTDGHHAQQPRFPSAHVYISDGISLWIVNHLNR